LIGLKLSMTIGGQGVGFFVAAGGLATCVSAASYRFRLSTTIKAIPQINAIPPTMGGKGMLLVFSLVT
jgi:hypothetical protein